MACISQIRAPVIFVSLFKSMWVVESHPYVQWTDCLAINKMQLLPFVSLLEPLNPWFLTISLLPSLSAKSDFGVRVGNGTGTGTGTR